MAHYDEQREQHDRENQSLSAGSTAEYDFHMAQALCSLEKAQALLERQKPFPIPSDFNWRPLARVAFAVDLLKDGDPKWQGGAE